MDPAVVIATSAVAAALVMVAAAIRRVPDEHCAVITRGGRVVRTRRSGPTWALPGLERVTLVALRPPALDPLSLTATTRDGVELRLVMSVLWQVTDPDLAARAGRDITYTTIDVIERVLHHLVANVDLGDLLRNRDELLSRLPVTARPMTASIGVDLIDVDLVCAEVRVGPELLRLLR